MGQRQDARIRALRRHAARAGAEARVRIRRGARGGPTRLSRRGYCKSPKETKDRTDCWTSSSGAPHRTQTQTQTRTKPTKPCTRRWSSGSSCPRPGSVSSSRLRGPCTGKQTRASGEFAVSDADASRAYAERYDKRGDDVTLDVFVQNVYPPAPFAAEHAGPGGWGGTQDVGLDGEDVWTMPKSERIHR